METLAEFLKSDKSQAVVLRRIVGMFRESGEWGKRGLYARIGSTMGLSPAYVGRVLTGKQSITDTFLEKMAVYFGVSVPWLRGEEDPVGIHQVVDEIREALGVGDDVALADLPGIIRTLRVEYGGLKALLEDDLK